MPAVVNVRNHSESRFNVLLTQGGRETSGHWTVEFPRLLHSQGVASYVAHTGREAFDLAERLEFHAAVIDLNTPVEDGVPAVGTQLGDAGWWLAELFSRLPNSPPFVIVHNAAYSQRQVARLLHEALRLGAFSVLNTPVRLEELLTVFQRLVDRQYRGTWPTRRPEGID